MVRVGTTYVAFQKYCEVELNQEWNKYLVTRGDSERIKPFNVTPEAKVTPNIAM